MGIIEAKKDGIDYRFIDNGKVMYTVHCEMCGRDIERLSYGRTMKYKCTYCRQKETAKRRALVDAWMDVIETKGERRYSQALDRIEKQVKDFTPYQKPARLARRAVERYGSIPEAMVAVELLRLGYPFIPQQKIGKYRVDFYIPKSKFILEVDGGLYHQGKYITDREATIQFNIGLDVKIIHVSAELISENIQKLGEYIDKALKQP